MPDHSWQSLLQPGRAEDFFTAPPAPMPADLGPFHPASAWWLAELSRLAYRDAGRDALLRSVGLRELDSFDNGGAHAFLLTAREGPAPPPAIAVFRGTDDLRDWMANLQALPVRWPRGGTVHGGFRGSLARIWRPLRRALAARPGPAVLAGHSLGGALALLAGSLVRPRAVWTFGAPPVGDATFARSLAGIPVHRLVHGRDLVPRLELPGLAHTGELHRLGTGGEAARPAAPPAREDRRWYEPPPFLADHAPVNYVDALRPLAAANGHR